MRRTRLPSTVELTAASHGPSGLRLALALYIQIRLSLMD